MPRKTKKSTAKKSGGSRAGKGFIICPYTHDKIFVAKATLQDLKCKTTTKTACGKKQKRLWTIASVQTRQEHYSLVAQAMAKVEQDLLPSSGGRSWEVSVTLSEPNTKVLFRNVKGKMELAVMPHLLDRIPEPPAWPGKYRQAADEYEAMQGEEAEAVAKKKHYYSEQEYIDKLTTREIDELSSVAYEELRQHPHNHPVPVVSTKWKSPDAKSFTSRKTAWEYAEVLAKQEVFINKNLCGIGASGKLLQVFFPSPKTALELGKLRFVRDGLWVIGQELGWQEARPEEWQEQQQEQEEDKAQQLYKSGVQMFVQTQRHQYKHNHADTCSTLQQADKELRKQWRMLPPSEQQVWNDKVAAQFESSDDEASDSEVDDSDASSAEEEIEYVSPVQYFLQKRRVDYRYERQMELKAEKFTLAQADKELRKIWKDMSEEARDQWIDDNASVVEEAEESDAEEDDAASCADDNKQEDENESGEEEADKELNAATESDEKPTEATNDTTRAESVSVSSAASIESKDVGKQLPPSKGTDDKNEPTTLARPVSTTSHTDESSGQSPQHAEEKKEEAQDMTIAREDATEPTLAPSAFVSAAAAVEPSHEQATPSSNEAPAFPPKQADPEPMEVEEQKQKEESIEEVAEAPVSGVRARAKVPPPKTVTRYCMKPDQISLCHDACMDHFETVMRTVKTRDLARELADGFDVLRERGRGRFDMELPAFDTPQFNFLHDFKKTPWMPVVRAILGEDVVLIHKGAFLSLPGADAQVYHQDGVHLNKHVQKPCHAINVFIPLVDLQMKNGPTEFTLGSHVLGHDGYDRDFLQTPTPTAGTPVIFDYRLGHRGLSNSSHSVRPIVYCTYARAADGKEFRDQVNFSRKRYHKIGDLSAKPLSREERKNKRKERVESREDAEIRKALELSASDSKPQSNVNGETDIDAVNESESEAKKLKVDDSAQTNQLPVSDMLKQDSAIGAASEVGKESA